MVLALLAAGLVFCGTAAASFVPATSPRIKTMGRWIPADNGSLYAGRGGVLASAKFEGTGVQVQMYSDSQGDCWWLKKLDDGPLIRFKVQMGMNVLFQNLPMGKHTLFMIRDTEGMRGVTIPRLPIRLTPPAMAFPPIESQLVKNRLMRLLPKWSKSFPTVAA